MALSKQISIPNDVLNVLLNLEWRNSLECVITGQLERTLYTKVNKILEALGGKWNRGKQCHVFTVPPQDTIANALETNIVMVEKDGYFPTPEPIVHRMMSKFGSKIDGLVLEPEAGTGHIVDVLRGQYDVTDIHCIEKNASRQRILKDKGYKLVGDDFMQFLPDVLYPFIVMNPPFENQQDIDHIEYAFDTCLQTGGQMTAICSESPFFRTNKKSTAFLKFIDSYGVSERLPIDSFKESGTQIHTRLIYFKK